MRKCWLLKPIISMLGVTGAVIAIIAVYAMINLPDMINKKIEKEIPLKEGTETFKKWQKVAVPIWMKFYFFDVKNPYEVMNFGHQPVVEERGPYVFRETRERHVHHFENDGEIVVYREVKHFYFDEDKSAGSLDDIITVPNIPEIAAVDKILEIATNIPGVGTVVNGMINSAMLTTQTQVLGRQRVGDLLFDGYKVRALEQFFDISSRIPVEQLKMNSTLPNNTFGFFYMKNGTTDPDSKLWRINTGLKDASKIGSVISYDDKKEMDCWQDYYCNQLNGTDGSAFHPNIQKGEKMFIFSPDIYRSVYLEYSHQVSMRDIPAYRYVIPKSFYSSPKKEPENKCFCQRTEYQGNYTCGYDGVFDISKCRKAPILVSAPHFLRGDPKLVNDVIGLNPKEQLHTTYVDIEPMTGMVINAIRRAQINIEIRQNNYIAPFNRLTKRLILPVMWLEETAGIDEVNAQLFKSKLVNKIKMLKIAFTLAVTIGIIMLVISIIYFTCKSVAPNSVKARKQTYHNPHDSFPMKS